MCFVFPMWWAIPTFTHFPGKNRTSPWLVRLRDVAVLTEWQSWGATSGLTITQSGALFTSANWQFRTPRAFWLELVWIPGLHTLATAQSALDLSPPSKKKTYLMTSLFWIPWPSNSLPTTLKSLLTSSFGLRTGSTDKFQFSHFAGHSGCLYLSDQLT